ncbi:hypothetical protein C8J56DRAFT_1172213 [Mycena floridula]|nr:hypothetical protein C8J56DRAFT_1172213 [Mycena floridula]
MTPSASQLYAELLLPSGNGYPLWRPEPLSIPGLDPQLREERLAGPRIGDVGTITFDGGFDFLFNICCASNDPRNAEGVPAGFDHIKTPTEIAGPQPYHEAGVPIASSDVRKMEVDNQAGLSDVSPVSVAGGFQYQSSSSKGAILVLPKGADRTDLRNLGPFEKFAFEHGTSWFEYAVVERGRPISNDSLYLITGFDNSTSWGVAAFSDQSRSGGFNFKLLAGKTGLGTAVKYQWDQLASAEGRVGPDLSDSEVPRSNQCVFLRGFRLTVSQKWLRKKLKADFEVRDIISSSERLKQKDFNMTGSSRENWLRKRPKANFEVKNISSNETLKQKDFNMTGSPQTSPQENSQMPSGTEQTIRLESLSAYHPLNAVNSHLLDQTAPLPSLTMTYGCLLSTMHDDDGVQNDLLDRIHDNFQITTNQVSEAEAASFAPNDIQLTGASGPFPQAQFLAIPAVPLRFPRVSCIASSLMDKEKDIQAKNSVDKTGTLRRDALTRLIALTNSDSSSLKIVAADNMQRFFNHFPDLESAINATTFVQIQDYGAITQLSKMEKRWVKRNLDVLLQLLQSDEEAEVKVVKKALVITPANAESIDDEDAALPDRLRSLVIGFMTNEARRAIIRRATPESASETMLITGIQWAIPSLDDSDLRIIFQDLVISLPSLQSPPSTLVTALLLALLEASRRSRHAWI